MRVLAALAAVVMVLAACTHKGIGHAEPADYVGTEFSAPGTGARTVDPHEAQLRGPHFVIQFTSVEITDLTDDLNGPAPGHEFIAARTDDQQRFPMYVPGSDADRPSAVVVVDGVARKLPEVPQLGGLIVSVPKGHDAVLQITDEGRTQSLRLRDMTRGPDAIPGYYRPFELSTKGISYDETATAAFLRARIAAHAKIDFPESGASLDPWIPGLQWTEPGRVWLTVTGITIGSDLHVTNADSLDLPTLAETLRLGYDVDTDTSFGLSFPGGTAAPVPEQQESTTYFQLNKVLVFDVPDSFAGGTLVVHPAEQLTVGGNGVKTSAITWPKRFPARQYPVTL